MDSLRADEINPGQSIFIVCAQATNGALLYFQICKDSSVKRDSFLFFCTCDSFHAKKIEVLRYFECEQSPMRQGL